MASEIEAGNTVKGNMSGTEYNVVHVDGDALWCRSGSGVNIVMRIGQVTKVEPFFKVGEKYRVRGLDCCTYETVNIDALDGKLVAILRKKCRFGDLPYYVVRSSFNQYFEIK
jgi:hypothetical protein